MDVNLRALVDRLDPIVRQSLDQAAWLCRSMTHYEIELEHLFVKLFEVEEPEMHELVRTLELDRGRLQADLKRATEGLKRGNTRETPAFSPHVPELLRNAWLQASIEHGRSRIHASDLVAGLVEDPGLRALAHAMSRELAKIDPRRLGEAQSGLAPDATSAEDSDGPESGAGVPAQGAKALERFTIDLTARARAGDLDPVLGRDAEIRQLTDVLMRRRQNNPILTGEPGVGKTAVVEGLALKIATRDVPAPLRDVSIRSLDLGLLQAGAGVRGEFEERLKNVIAEVKGSPKPVVVFIDEAHTMIGSGGSEGQSDAANLLKPALARGELRTIAATTWAEYKKYFEKDAALARRFQVVKVEEPDEDTAITMLRGVAAKMEGHHGVIVKPEAVESAVRLSARYLSERQLPDKAVSVLDTAGARVAIGLAAVPAELEDARAGLADLRSEADVLERETRTGADHGARLDRIHTELEECTLETAKLDERWQREKEHVERIHTARAALGALSVDAPETERRPHLDQLADAEELLRELQGESPLIHPFVDTGAVARIVGQWTGIPLGRMLADEIRTVLDLELHLATRVLGQDHALRALAQRIQTSRASLDDPGRPVGVFLLVGPSGVGKTESALALAELLYGGERNLITINMSEYQEAHTVANLKGSPRGYVGYGEGGVLTEAVRRRPYSVVLLDEVEKAHPDVMELFYQVFDKGWMEDGEGREIDFKNTIILLTSNLATDTITRACSAPQPTDAEELRRAIHPEITAHFKPALVGRMTVVPYFTLDDAILRRIVDLKLEKVRERLAQHHEVTFEPDAAVADAILERCTEADTGARNVEHVITGSVLPEVSRLLLGALADGQSVHRLAVRVEDGRFEYELE